MKKIIIKTISVITLAVILIGAIVPSEVEGYYTNMSASIVVGQPDFLTNSTGTTQSKLKTAARGIQIDPQGRLIIGDATNNRVLIWNSIPTSNGAPADLVLGQADFVSGSSNRGGSIAANTLSNPTGVFSDGSKLLVVDNNNDRVLIWNSFPTVNGQAADVAVGSTDLISNPADVCNASTFANPYGLWVYQGKLFVTDLSQNRILIWNSIPTNSGASADIVVGQQDLTTCSSLSVSSQSINDVRSVMVDSNGRMVVADKGRQRVLIWNSVPTSNFAAADVVVGQPDFTSSGAAVAADRVSNILQAFSNGNRLFIPDTSGGQRVLIFNTIPTSNGASADIVIGQQDFTSHTTNGSTGSISASGFNQPQYAFEYNNNLLVMDDTNARVLIFRNVLVTPSINLPTPPVSIGNGRYRLTGNVFMNTNNQTYGLQKLNFDVNGTDNGGVAVSGGRDDGNGNTIYDFNYDFDPTVGGGSINNLTIKILATTYNNDTNTLFYFLPFNFKSFNVSSTKSQNFTFSVNKDQLQRIKDNLDHFEVWYKPNTTTGKWVSYISNIGKDKIDQNGLVSYNKTTNNIRFIGSYIFKVVAVDNWGNRQDSNLLYIAGTGPITKTSYASFARNFVTPPPTIIASFKPVPAQTTNTSPVPIPLPTIETINSSNTGLSEEGVLKIIFIVSSVLAILFLIILLSRRRKSEETN